MLKALRKSSRKIDRVKVNQLLKGFFICLFAFVMSRGEVLGYNPMIVAYYSCSVSHKKVRFFVFLSAIVGMFSKSIGRGSIKYMLILMIISTVIYLLDYFNIAISTFKTAIMGMIITFVLGYALPIYINNNSFGLMGALLEGGSVLVISMFFKPAIDNFLIKQEMRLTKEIFFSLVALLGGVLLGVAGESIAQLPVIDIGICLVLLLASYRYGMEASAIIGVVTGGVMTYAMGSESTFSWFILWSVLGVVLGVFRQLGKWGVLIAYVALYGLLSHVLLGWDIIKSMEVIIITSSIFVVIPTKVVSGEQDIQDEVKSEENSYVIERLQKVAATYEQLANKMKNVNKRDVQLTKSDIDQLIDDVAARVCVNCSLCHVCWEKQFYTTYRTIYSILSEIEVKGEVNKEDIPMDFYNQCLRLDEFVRMVNRIFDIYKINLKWENKLDNSRELFAEQLATINHVLVNLKKDLEVQYDHKENVEETYRMVKGIARRSKGEHSISGDTYSFINTEGGHEVVSLSDGMGSGEKAFMDSKLAIEMLELMLESGFTMPTILKTINTLLGVKNDYQSFATMDVTMLNKYTGECHFIKNGAVSTYIKRGNRVEILKADTLPLGMINDVQLKTIVKKLRGDDLLVMISDGIIDGDRDRQNNEVWLESLLIKNGHLNPSRLAEEILEKAKERYKGDFDDDMTVIVARIWEKPSKSF